MWADSRARIGLSFLNNCRNSANSKEPNYIYMGPRYLFCACLFNVAHRAYIQSLSPEELELALAPAVPLPPNVPVESLPKHFIPYGILVYTCVIRDLSGIGFEHIGSQGQEIIKAVMGVASDNYPGTVAELTASHQLFSC